MIIMIIIMIMIIIIIIPTARQVIFKLESLCYCNNCNRKLSLSCVAADYALEGSSRLFQG